MDALHAIERTALDHVDGAPSADLLRRSADALGRTQIVLDEARGHADPTILEDSAYVDPDLLAVAREHDTTPDMDPLFEALPRFRPDRPFRSSAFTS